MDIEEINKIEDMMEEVHHIYFPKLLKIKQQTNFPFDLLEDDLVVLFANRKNNEKKDIE